MSFAITKGFSDSNPPSKDSDPVHLITRHAFPSDSSTVPPLKSLANKEKKKKKEKLGNHAHDLYLGDPLGDGGDAHIVVPQEPANYDG